MPRDLASLAGARYDLLVIGGGIHGLFAAYDAAERGLSVALVEARDFGGALSASHQRTLHGGLRSLERGRLGKARAEIAERRTWAQIAPHLVRPLPFLIGTYRFTKRSPTAVRLGFAAYDAIGRRRNLRVSPELHLPHCRLESAATTRRLFPGIREAGLGGGAVWYEYQTRHPDRLNWVVALAARRAGAALVNYAEAIAPLRDGARVAGARVRDALDGREYDVQAAVTLAAAGSGLRALLTAFGTSGAPPLARAMNILIDRPARDLALAAPGRSGRMLTAVPWRGYVLVGTHQSSTVVDNRDGMPPAADPVELDAFIEDANHAFPALGITRADVRLVHRGLTPAVVRGGRVDLAPDPIVIDHASSGAPGLVSLAGVKFTTSRVAAARAVSIACRVLGRPTGRSRTGAKPLPHADIADVEGLLTEALRARLLVLDRDVTDHLTSWYGTEASDVVGHAADANLLDRLVPGRPILAGEIAYAVARADARRLSDAVLRRTPLGSAGHPGCDALARAADIMGGVLAWDADRRRREIADVEAVYPPSASTAVLTADTNTTVTAG